MTRLAEQLAGASPERPVRVGRYEVTGVIGTGGMGVVYDAVDAEHGDRVALKTLAQLDARSLVRFKNEFRAVAELSHPNLVSLHELACEDDLWFFTMEYVDGVDFVEWLRGEPSASATPIPGGPTVAGSPRAARKGRAPGAAEVELPAATETRPTPAPSESRVRDALAQLASAVHALHAAGLVHQDIKPSNVLVDRAGRVVVLDFGLVRRHGDASDTGSGDDGADHVSGTPMWMAPEQFSSGTAGPAADWYAVGLMLYLCLTGVPAFPESDDDAAGYLRQYLVPQPPAERLPGVAEDLSDLTEAMLATDPADRPTGESIVRMTGGDEDARSSVARRIVGARFVGRRAELARIHAAVSRTVRGGASAVLVRAGSGAGKSALVRTALDDLRADRRALVLCGRCYERETVPYKGFDGVAEDLAARLAIEPADDVRALLPPADAAALAAVFPVLDTVPAWAEHAATAPVVPASVPAVERRRRAVEAMRGLVASLARRWPVAMAIDDLQWADDDTMRVLSRLVSAPVPAGLCVIACVRPDEVRSPGRVADYLAAVESGAVHDDVDATVIELGPLADADAALLAGGILAAHGVTADGLGAAIARESGGVPFFVEELARYAAAHHGDAGKVPAGVSLDSVLAWRAQSLPASQRELVEVLSVANSPIPLGAAFDAAGLATAPMREVWALRAERLVRSAGGGVTLHHDRMRESVLGYLDAGRVRALHLALGRSLAARVAAGDRDALFDAVRHLNAAARALSAEERLSAARLDLIAGRDARRAGAFGLAFDCFDAGAELLGDDAWESEYDLRLALACGAAEAAYLCSEWDAVTAHVDEVVARGRTVLDQLDAWEVAIDAAIARRDYAGAVDAGVAVLALLGVEVPANPGEAEVGAAVQDAMAAVAEVGPDGLLALPAASEPSVVAAMRAQGHLVSAAYFGRPMLLPVLACRITAASVRSGLAPATAYGLAVYGIVLNTLGMHPQAHEWGQTALRVLERFPDDRAFEAKTRHVVHNLVCSWTVPLRDTLARLRAVVDVGKETGDIEYAAYAAHAYVHNAMYAGVPLADVFGEAVVLGDFMREHEEVNALHFHVLFEQLQRCLLGLADDPASLDGNGFSEADALAAGDAADSHSAQCLVRVVMAMARYAFGNYADASRLLEEARPVLDGIASTWHVPMFHQYAALSIHALPPDARERLRAAADADLAALRSLAEHGPDNFAHRVALVEAERARADGDTTTARNAYARAIELAEAGHWTSDVGLAHELAARCERDAGDAARAAHHRAAARAAYDAWGAVAKVDRLS